MNEDKELSTNHVALAAFSLVLNFVSKLRQSGALSRADCNDIFSDAIAEHRRIGTPANDVTASFMEQARKSIEQE